MRLDDKTAMVTGAGSGIGKAIAIALARVGAKVVLAARREGAINQVAAEIEGAGGRAFPVVCDIADETSVDALYAKIDEKCGRLDLLVNNAGTLALHPIDGMPAAEWDRVIAVNLRGTFLCSQRALSRMKLRGGGRIVSIGSLSAMRVRANNSAYNATKFALEGFTQSLALEGRPFGIAASILHPGNTISEITRSADFPEARMDADEVARVVLTMVTAPADVNIFSVVMHPLEQTFIGRG